jgi:hypothetical protein
MPELIMKTYLDTEYRLFVSFGKKLRPLELDFWREAMNILQPLTDERCADSGVHAVHDNTTKTDFVESGPFRWIERDLETWAVPAADRAELSSVDAYFPALSVYRIARSIPDLFFKLSTPADPNESRYDFITLLAVRDDVAASLGADALIELAGRLRDHVHAVFAARTSHPWALQESEGRWAHSLDYFFPSMVLANGSELVIREGYEAWERF